MNNHTQSPEISLTLNSVALENILEDIPGREILDELGQADDMRKPAKLKRQIISAAHEENNR